MKKVGFSITEILVTIAVLTILAGVGADSYRSYILKTTKTKLNNSAKKFAFAVRSCIKEHGGWEVKRFSKSTESCPAGESEPCQKAYPCKAVKGADSLEELKNKLIKKLDYTCPVGAVCKAHMHSNTTGADGFKYYCLSLEQAVSGQKLQVLVKVPYHAPSKDQKIWCNNVSSYVELKDETCKRSIVWGSNDNQQRLNTFLNEGCDW